MTYSRILDYLDANPDGDTPQQIADHINGRVDSVACSLGRLETHGKVEKIAGTKRGIHAIWVRVREETPPVFRAMETLRAMQDACRARLTANQLEAV
jgi:hypothetical protein